MLRRFAAPIIAFALVLLVAAPALSGGWAEVVPDARTVEPPPVEGQPIELGFTVLQHGVTPAGWEAPTVTFTERSTGESFQVTATGSGADGHFVAPATIPRAGAWTWSVTLRDLVTDPVANALAVATPDVVVPVLDPAGTSGVPLIGIVTLTILAGAAGFTLAWLARRSRPRELDVSA